MPNVADAGVGHCHADVEVAGFGVQRFDPTRVGQVGDDRAGFGIELISHRGQIRIPVNEHHAEPA